MNTYDIFVYCGGKCGSSTLYNTFINNGFSSIHVHSNYYYYYYYYYYTFCTLNNDDSIFDVIDDSCKSKEIYLFDSYRNPIERKISSFFQNLSIHVVNYRELSVFKYTCSKL
jgi:hypothetical protein